MSSYLYSQKMDEYKERVRQQEEAYEWYLRRIERKNEQR